MGLFSSEYRSLLKPSTLVKEPPLTHLSPEIQEGVGKQITEEIVRCLWFGKHFVSESLHTEDGSRLEILAPGRWNKEAGPDHLNAEILLEGKGYLKGDVEIHVLASDWRRHGHDEQENYSRVCLHVVFWNDREGHFVKDFKGRDIPQIALSKYVTLPLEDLADLTEGLREYSRGSVAGPCRELLSRHTQRDDWVAHLLDRAGDYRMILKAQRKEAGLKDQSFEDLLYRSLMEAMGYKNNVVGFSLLSSSVHLADIRYQVPTDVNEAEAVWWIQAFLFGASGILAGWSGKNLHNEDGRKYLAFISELWAGLRDRWSGEPLSPELWRWEGTRPFNSPVRRMAAMSTLLARGLKGGLFREFLSPLEGVRGKDTEEIRKAVKRLEAIFLGLEDSFWSHHLTVDGNRLETPARLVGQERASIILVNVIIPLLLLYARKHGDKELEGILHEAYGNYPRLQPDSIVKYMTKHVLPEEAQKLINTARRQQGLHQLYRDFCQRRDVSCDRCGFYVAVQDRHSAVF